MKITLDNTLRFLYDSLRYKRGYRLVAIEFEHAGKKWRADTAKEAIELRDQLEAIERGDTPTRRSIWDVGKVTDALNSLGKLQQQLLIYVYLNKVIKSYDLVVALNLPSEVALAGVLSGLSKQVREFGAEMKDVLRIDVTWQGKTKERKISISPDFQTAAEAAGWPESWQQKLDMEVLDEIDKELGK
jgi:hypothetical protein